MEHAEAARASTLTDPVTRPASPESGEARGAAGPSDPGEPQQVHDELTDLFIGDIELDEREPLDAPRRPHDDLPNGVGHAETGAFDEDPVLSESLDDARGPFGQAETLGGPAAFREAADGDDAEDATRPIAEGLLIGRLPVRASVWVRQYAGEQAKIDGRPVGLIRVAGGGVSVELVGPRPRALRVGAEQAATLLEALSLVRRHAGRVLVRVDELDQAQLLEASWFDEITVLAGPTEADAVTTYRLVKAAAGALDANFGEGEGPAVGLATMAADEAASLAAWERVNAAAQRFLGRPIERRLPVEKVSPRQTTVLARLSEAPTLDDLGEAWLSGDVGEEQERAEVAARETAGYGEGVDSLSAEASYGEAPAGADRGGPAPAAFDEIPSPPATAESFVEAKAASAEDEAGPRRSPPLASHIAGLRPLGLPCPVAPGVELAVDARGGLHALAWAGEGSLAALHAAQAWADANLPLLRAVRPQLAGEPGVTPHLVSESFADLRGLLNGAVRLHLARRVEVGPHRVLVIDELD